MFFIGVRECKAFGYVLNNPLIYTDPSGEILVPILIGVGVAIFTNAISNLIQGIPWWHGMGKAATVGAISGAISFGIGDIVKEAFTSFIAKAAVQAGLHGMKGGIMSMAEGGSFMSGFASGAVSSLVSSGVEALGTDFGFQDTKGQYSFKNAFGSGSSIKAVMIASGGLSGGISSSIAGGSFWKGVREGIITSGLNHVAHMVVGDIQERKSLRSRFNKIDPDGKPNLTPKGLQDMRNDVDGLNDAWVDGGKPTECFTLRGDDQANTSTNGGKHVYYNPNKIRSNYQFAKAMFHEYRHCWQYITPITINGKHYESHVDAWTELYGRGYNGEHGFWDAMEYDAYSYQYRIGDSDTFTLSQLDKFYQRMLIAWKRK